jgi:hypothetical protein
VKNYSIRFYQQEDAAAWNDFVNQSENGSFLFHRNYMDYHKEQFQDGSVMVFESSNLVALLPANQVGKNLFSHQGLTYGGIIFTEKMKLPNTMAIYQLVLRFLNENHFERIYIKPIPSIYTTYPAEDFRYLFFLLNAKIARVDSLSVIDMNHPIPFSKLRKRAIKKGIQLGLEIREEHDFDLFWNKILKPNLKQRHQTKPVHQLHEIALLASFFPEKIRQFNVYYQDEIVGGCTVFETKNVAHCQYISKYGNEDLGALDVLFQHLIENIFKNKNYFDFGISNENNGQLINEGLLAWKEGFGARTIVQEHFEIETANYVKLDHILI